MASDDYLGTYDHQKLRKYLSESKKIPKPKKVKPVNKQPDIPNSDDLRIKYQVVTLSFKFRDLFRNWYYSGNINSAVARWLQPEGLKLDDIDRLRCESNLDYMDTKSFASALKDACREIAIQDKPVSLWVYRRIALLDYLLFPPSGQSIDLLEADLKLGICLSRARKFLESNLIGVRKYAKETLAQALESAAKATSRILGPKPEDCQVWANLMIPINEEQLISPFFSSNTQNNDNITRAHQLWQYTSQPISKVLVVVAETGSESNHFGFWVPVYNADSLVLPGAPMAYSRCEGSVVFRDDLPPLNNFSDEQKRAFQNYMAIEFKENLFVSLPLTLESSANFRPVIAVLNVNVRASNPDSWRRAYHLEWLREATNQVKSSLCQAYEAFQLICDTLESGSKLVFNPSFPDLSLTKKQL